MNQEKIYYRKGFKYQLAEDFFCYVDVKPAKDYTGDLIHLSKTGFLLIKKAYAWDGPSGPAIDTKNFMRGALVHDALYQLIRLGILGPEQRKPSDQELYKFCRADGMGKIRAYYVYCAVRWAASKAASPKSVKKVLQAP